MACLGGKIIKIEDIFFLCLKLYRVKPGLDSVNMYNKDRIKSSRTVTNESSSGGVAGQLENSHPPGKREKEAEREREKRQRERNVKLIALGKGASSSFLA